ncbi:MAG TPA: DUF29 domain-containing protein [Candidatus Competibacteraceae bacterium]|nr:DUF29 domain-containing protein [Candidatus Competibacteraceae bacterium]
MNRLAELYNEDRYAWALKNAVLMHEGRLEEVDLEHIAEELESMGRSERQELINRLTVLLAHLLKWRYQPERRGKSWRATIKEQRLRLHKHLAENPSLRSRLEESQTTAYEYAVLRVTQETPLEETTLPPECPFSRDQILNEGYWPD